MKRGVLGAMVTVLLFLSAGLVIYVIAARTTSSYQLQQFDTTVGFLSDRVAALEKQRDLLDESATAMESHLTTMKKRIHQIDVEIGSMSELVGSAGKSVRTPSFNWRNIRLTTGSSILIIVCLVFIWMLYAVFVRKSAPREEGHDAVPPPPLPSEEREPADGSVLEEEYPLPSESAESAAGAPQEEVTDPAPEGPDGHPEASVESPEAPKESAEKPEESSGEKEGASDKEQP